MAGEDITIDSVENLAVHYNQQLQTLQPQGPYLLLGVSFGGLVAYEMAQQLTAQGQKIAFLGLIDTTHPSTTQQRLNLDFVNDQATKHLHNLKQFGLIYLLRKIKSQIHWRAQDLMEMLLHLYCHTMILICNLVGVPFPDGVADFSYEQENQQVAKRYSILSYVGRITFFRATECINVSNTLVAKASVDNELRWQQLAAGGLEVHPIPGDHLGMLQEPYVQKLGDALQCCLAQATTRSSSH